MNNRCLKGDENLMNDKTIALQNYLNDQALNFADDWHSHQNQKSGSHYSPDAPLAVQTKIKEQSAQYLRYISQALLQSTEEMEDTISKWTAETSADRVESKTTLDEIVRSNKIFRKEMWKYVRSFVRKSDETITVEDIFFWEDKLNQTLDYILESFTYQFMNLLFDRLTSQASLIKELSAPVITLTPQVGLLPIIGDIDTDRAKGLLDSTLQQSVDSGIHILIIDLSGVVLIDTMVAQQIFQLIGSLRIVGVQTILTGIRPEVAQTSIQLGLDFSEIQTESSLQKIFQKLTKNNTFI